MYSNPSNLGVSIAKNKHQLPLPVFFLWTPPAKILVYT